MRSSWTLLLGLAACSEAPTFTLLEPPPPSKADGGTVTPDAGPKPRPDAGQPPPPPPPPGLPHGSACTEDGQCRGRTCIDFPPFSGGYCTLLDCTSDESCDARVADCVEAFGLDICAQRCVQGGCRVGYSCQWRTRFHGVCLPETLAEGRDDGEPCSSPLECGGRTCLMDPDWPQGHCTSLDCQSDADCASRTSNNQCLPVELPDVNAFSLCLRRCANAIDCREGYTCARVDLDPNTPGVCVPDRVEGPLPNTSNLPGTLMCLRAVQGRLDFDYTVPAGVRSYMATPLTRDGRYLTPLTLDLPNGQLDFMGSSAFQAVSAAYLGFINPTVVPSTNDRMGQLQAGLHHYHLQSRSTDACLWLQTETTPGDHIDLRFYFVGTSFIDAASAPSSTDFAAARATLAAVLAQAGLSIGTVSYRNVPEPDASRFRFLMSEEDFLELLARSEPSPNNPLVMNVFFVDGLSPELQAWGIAPTIAGPGGLHGTRASGVVSTAELLGVVLAGPSGEEVDGNEQTGLIVAHEIGHYLGLFHTTEFSTGEGDPINDTPVCNNGQMAMDCPDWGNVMFPFADPANHDLTPGQIFSISAHPLTKD